MLRRLKSPGRKDISREVNVVPRFEQGKVAATISFVNHALLKGLHKHEVFIRCTDRYRAQTIPAGPLADFGAPRDFTFDDFSKDHDPKIQVRIVDGGTKRIHADTREHDLPGSGPNPKGKRSLVIIRESDHLEGELFKVEWKETSDRPILFLNNRHQGQIKSVLLKDGAFWPLVKPALLRSVLSIIFSEGLHTEASSARHSCATKWIQLCKTKRWNLESAPTAGPEALTANANWINTAVDKYATSLGLPQAWSPKEQP